MKEIQQQIINYNKSARSSAPIYIVIHDTGDPGATAQNEHDYFAGGDRQASADFFVDSNNIIQIIDTDNNYSWHCGDGAGAYGITNKNSLGIEMCLESGGNPSDETVENTIELVQYLMSNYNIGIDNVVRHYDASRKSCPNSFMANNWARWYDFKDKLSSSSVKGEWIFDKYKNRWWYKHSDGLCTKDGWEKINDKWYYFDSEGWMIFDWKRYGYTWYYLSDSNNDGSMKTGWMFNNNKWYYCDETGAMKTGWLKDNGEWYYLDPTNGDMKTGWVNIDGKYYLLDSHGVMYSNITAYGYSFDSNGVATKL